MKKVLALIVVFALVLSMSMVSVFAAEEPVNWLENADVDGDTTSWGGWTTFVYSDDSHSADGTGSILYEATTNHGHASQEFEFEAGVTYYASVWVKVSSDYQMNTSGFNGYLIGIGAGGDWGGKQYGKINSNEELATEWTLLTAEFSFDEDTTTLFSLVCWGKSAGTVQFDDAWLSTAPNTGDCSTIAGIVVVAVIATAVVFTKKKEYNF